MSPSRKALTTPEGEFSSEKYWKGRYARGGNSGAGSYGRLAEYKSKYINSLVDRYKIGSVLEIGSGDGNQASKFTFASYTGVDLSSEMVARCRELFDERKDWAFYTASEWLPAPHDMSMSLDVIYHLVEDEVYEAYMNQLFNNAIRYVLIYASDKDDRHPAKHVRHRKFSVWVAKNKPNWNLLEAPENLYSMTSDSDPKTTSFASFKLFGIK